jgi:ParB-like chromosome segregation protein Spo0J
MNIDIQIEQWPIERLKPFPGNARTHSAAQIRQIAASITEFGWSNPILADADDGVIAGHARLLAAQNSCASNWLCLPRTTTTSICSASTT